MGNTGWFYGNYLYNGNPVSSGLYNSVGDVNDYINNQLTANSQVGSVQDIMKNIHDRVDATSDDNLWNIFKKGLFNNFKEDPVAFAGGVVGLGGGLWNAYNSYKNQKEAMAIRKEAYNLQKQLALNAEQRNQEQWDMMKRQRASTSL